ncbi:MULTISPECIES: 4Fe-4S binding protein [unclassified Massilia]|uniref:4Fe-4S binding protein n=1 Tax=unclassified Massilia TaxID=2609279 RepID=UPI00177F41D8|nr:MULTISPECIES: 4Fe-4S binding protein [unclassified Massilia]MBD8530068.1 4Fe-4S binding protein [Massilia sp. CFBP 13647]MBD8674103.1 4Fe-4S binding protein [Massilia sp. CFBP 13721]
MNIRFLEGQAGDPLQERRNALAKTAAILAQDSIAAPEPGAAVSYRSTGRTLVVGSSLQALAWADHLANALPVTLLLLDNVEIGARPYPVFVARTVAVAGWLGAFEARWQAPNQPVQQGKFDLVLDLSPSPLISTHQHPHGYYAPGVEDADRRAAAAEIMEMTGDFDKPKYFAYKERLCAHSRNQLKGCTACIDICSAKAISSDGDRVKVNPYLCAGCGACSTVCPTGAMNYVYPSAAHTGSRIKAALRAYFEAGGQDPVLLLHSADGAPLLDAVANDPATGVPGRVIPLGLHHTASTGIDVWLAALSYGAAGITVLTTDAEAPQYAAALDTQMRIAQAVLDGLGYAGPHFQLLRVASPQELAVALQHAPRGATPAQSATFNLAQDKRNTLDYALDHLFKHARQQPEAVPLPAGAPFGAIAVDKQSCSLCMACVGACPSSAIMDTPTTPQLRFVEQNCVQCGLCANTCPENAITLVPRMAFGETRRQTVVLNETEPFHCIRCNKAFGTLRMVENMLGRLAGHSAFAGNLDRLKMCGDCRVIDMMQPEGELSVPLRRPR